MNTSKKITINGPSGKSVITYPTEQDAAKAALTMKKLNTTRITNVPCDIETGKTEKIAFVANYKAEIK